MEPILLIALFMLAGNNPDELKTSLYSAMQFYRENRELFNLLLQTQQKNTEEKPERKQEKNRPAEDGNFEILENFLKSRNL